MSITEMLKKNQKRKNTCIYKYITFVESNVLELPTSI